MDCLSRSLFDEFNDDSQKKTKFQRPCTPPVINVGNMLPLPCIVEDTISRSEFLHGDDFNSSGEMFSPPCSPTPCSPTKFMSPSPSRLLQSPPSIQRGFLALKLFDTPHTPKTLLSKFKSAANESTPSEGDKDHKDVKKNKRLSAKSRERFSNMRNIREGEDRKRPTTEPRDKKHVVYANINPFTPSPSVVKHKRTRQEFER